jgi:hypothetical protein
VPGVLTATFFFNKNQLPRYKDFYPIQGIGKEPGIVLRNKTIKHKQLYMTLMALFCSYKTIYFAKYNENKIENRFPAEVYSCECSLHR